MNTLLKKQKYLELDRVKRKEKKAWAMYYESVRQYFYLLQYIKDKTSNDVTKPPSCFVDTITELYNEANKKLECIICTETMTKQTFAFTNCLHIMCINCIKEISKNKKQCPTCRRNL